MTPSQCVFDLQSPVAGALHYDLTTVRSATAHEKDVQVGPTIQFQYRVNVCGNVAQVCMDNPSVATETLIIPAGQTCRNLGTLEPQMASYTLVPPFIQDRGRNPQGVDFQISYYGGDTCEGDESSGDMAAGGQTARSVAMQIACDLSLPAGEVNIVDVKKESECETTFVLATADGCANTQGGGPSITLFWCILMGIIYCAIGVVFNRFYRKKEWGREIVPHLAFWLDFPSLVKDGCKFSWEMAQACREKGIKQAMLDEFGGRSSASDAGSFGSGTKP